MPFDFSKKVEKAYTEAYRQVALEAKNCGMRVNFAKNKKPSLTIRIERNVPWHSLELQHQKYGFEYLPEHDTFVLSPTFLKLNDKERELVLYEMASYSVLMRALEEEVELKQEKVQMLSGAAFIEALAIQSTQDKRQVLPLLPIYNFVDLFSASISKIDNYFSTMSSYGSFENAKINASDYSYILKTLRSAGIQDQSQQFFLTVSILASADLMREEDFYKQYVNAGYQLAKRLNPRENMFGQLIDLIRHAESESELGISTSRLYARGDLNEYGNDVADLLDKMKNLCNLDSKHIELDIFDYILPIAGVISGKFYSELVAEELQVSGAAYYDMLCDIAQATGEIKGELAQLLRRP